MTGYMLVVLISITWSTWSLLCGMGPSVAITMDMAKIRRLQMCYEALAANPVHRYRVSFAHIIQEAATITARPSDLASNLNSW